MDDFDVPGLKTQRSYRKWVWLALAGVAAAVMVAGSTHSATDGSSDSHAASQPDTVKVLYEVEGTAKAANLTLESGTGTVQQNDKVVPLVNKSGTKGLTATMLRGDFAYISAQNQGAFGTVTCRITVDGVVISSNESSGAYAIVSCSGRAG